MKTGRRLAAGEGCKRHSFPGFVVAASDRTRRAVQGNELRLKNSERRANFALPTAFATASDTLCDAELESRCK
jgi:hypothetical protein